jgi:hypothetical protein
VTDYLALINRALANVFGSAESRPLEMGPQSEVRRVHDIGLDDTPAAFPPVVFPVDEDEVTKVWRRKPQTRNDDFWAGVKRSAALTEGLPKYTQAGLAVSDNFNGSLPPVASLKRGL